jgi:hypothetical protein
MRIGAADPDAPFILRLSYGAIMGYQLAGRTIAPFTTIAGAFDRATSAAPLVRGITLVFIGSIVIAPLEEVRAHPLAPTVSGR